MTLDRRDRVLGLFKAALELPPEKRATFLAEVCGNETELRPEVESLLAHEEQGGVPGTPTTGVES